jgi:hypothetical protein
MKRINIIILFSIFSLIFSNIENSFALDKSKSKKEQSKKKELTRAFIAQVEYTPNVEEITDKKVEAAMNLVCELSGKYKLFTSIEIDNAIDDLKKLNREPTAYAIADQLGADQILFIQVSRLANMLRTEITGVNMPETKKKSTGIGYALLHYREQKTDKIIYDPNLLESLQRSFASMQKDPLMFMDAEQKYRIHPVPTLVIGGVEFKDDKTPAPWQLFDKNVVNSFMITEGVFEVVRESADYAVYDMESRDSIYALFNLHIVENYRPPTSYELDALTQLGVDYYITGIIKREEDGALLQLYLCKISKKQLIMQSSAEGTLTEDSVEGLKKVVRETALKLISSDKK